mgnify:CR=1 FL=1
MQAENNVYHHKIQRRQTLVSYAFLMPALCFFTLFVVIPMALGMVTSFYKYTMKEFTFIGLENYKNLFKDEIFLKSVVNTLIIVVGSVPIVTAFSLWVSTIIYKMSSIGRSFYRGVFYLPVVTGSVAVVVVWKWIFNRYYGILNYLMKGLGIISKDVAWLGNSDTALWCILVILFTTSIGQPIVLYIASLGNIDKSLIEAAEVDGATPMQVFWRIKWPNLMPTTLYIVVITTINSFQCFALIQLLTSGGPNYSTSTVMYYLYDTAFRIYDYGYANSMGVILALLIGVFSAVQFKTMGNKIDY